MIESGVENWRRGLCIVVRDDDGVAVGRTCAECGRIMLNDLYAPRLEFCCRECYAAYEIRRAEYGWPRPSWIKAPRNQCPVCGKSGYFNKYCTRACSNRGRSAENRRKCRTCGGPIAGRGSNYCSRRCYGAAKKKP